METKAVLDLFDSYWFEVNILRKNSSADTSITSGKGNLEYETKEEKEEELEPKLPLIRTSHTRSMSDQSMTSTRFNNDSLSPDSVLLLSPKLQTILSGKEVTGSEGESPTQVRLHEVLCPENRKSCKLSGNGTRKRRESKSLSDLEFEELKGFMDLGFVFSEEDKNTSLVSIIPGLQRLGKKEEEEKEERGDCNELNVPRPYLSEAWEVREYGKRKKENPLVNWKIPALNNENDMKDSLRWWAHRVASTVR
ncbi:hypothetical protein LR48_Vigan01g044200 [Vigna angularis]|uniref:DUF1685 domain-containing protein n=2 Tax=Phaseolus angularis TaxID=3914 RepID=A0A0L9TKB5_PHAAN|nr:uncharacterized protein LOC108338987 [Vigna angularis]KAG2410288.1 uncharacterized protein HKW66_Vig0009530 [Vigna angularis]KOM30887.1 hypothetical protein LR48_Vigan01g044200 [Vigna angularis]BAU03069.1 hypothetical protein VIGAN_UM007400 [Vigna angularis var. angularis]